MEKTTQEKYDGSRLVTLEYYDARESENMKLIMGWFEQFETRICEKIGKEMQEGFAGIHTRIDELESKSVTVSQHSGLEKRVEKLEHKLKFA